MMAMERGKKERKKGTNPTENKYRTTQKISKEGEDKVIGEEREIAVGDGSVWGQNRSN